MTVIGRTGGLSLGNGIGILCSCKGILDCSDSILEPLYVIRYRSLDGSSRCSYDICQGFPDITEGETTYGLCDIAGYSPSTSWKLRRLVLSGIGILLVP